MQSRWDSARGLARLVVFGVAIVAGCGSGAAADSAGTRALGAANDASAGDAATGALAGDAAAAGDAGDAGDAATADAADASTADITLGAPIPAPDGVWTSVPFPQAYCRDGSQAHLMVHLNGSSKKVAIYEEGGGACFNDTTCKLLTFDPPSYALGQGIFNFTRADNPIRDWNIFYVPYCTGDVHAGDNAAAMPGPLTGTAHFAGYSNMRLYLARILATVHDPTDLALLGSSAGGFGAGLTSDLVARNAPASVERFTMIDDSGAPMSSTYLPTCLQRQWRTVWGLGNTVLNDCGAACPNPDDFVTDYVRFLIGKWANGPTASKFMAGLISATGDSIMSTFFGYGANDCMMQQSLTPQQFEAGLIEMRAMVRPLTPRFGTFFYAGSAHTTLIQDVGSGVLGGLYDTQANGVKLADWVRDLLAHTQATHVGP